MQHRAWRLALAVTTVAAASVVIATQSGDHHQAVGVSGVAHSEREAADRARSMLDRTYLLGAVRVPPPAGYTSDHPHEYEVQDERWLAVAGTPVTLVHTLDADPPTGLVKATADELTVSESAAATELRPVGQGSSLIQLLDVSATNAGRGRAIVLVQAIVAWLPPRTAAETIGPDVTTGELSSGFGDSADAAALRQRLLTTTEVRALAAALDARPTVSPYDGDTCQEGALGLAILTVPHGRGVALYQIDIGSCGQVQVQVDGKTEPNLAGGAALSSQVEDLLYATPAGT